MTNALSLKMQKFRFFQLINSIFSLSSLKFNLPSRQERINMKCMKIQFKLKLHLNIWRGCQFVILSKGCWKTNFFQYSFQEKKEVSPKFEMKPKTVSRWLKLQSFSIEPTKVESSFLQGGQDHFLPKEMLISPSILKLHKNPWIWEGLRTIHFI